MPNNYRIPLINNTMLTAVKRLVLNALPHKMKEWLRRERIKRAIRKGAFLAIDQGHFTPSVTRPMCIPRDSQSWKERLSKPYGHEPELVRWYERNLLMNDVLYDVGVEVGYYAALSSGLQPGISFHGFEGSWWKAEFFMLNKARLDKSNRWHTTQKMVGDHDDDTFVSINNYIRTHAVPTIFQMDVDGDEISVMRGAGALLGNGITTFIIETHPVDLVKRGKTVQEFLNFFDPGKYDLRYLPDLRAGVSAWTERLDEAQLEDEFYTLAIPKGLSRF